jgi:quercetin dioxygenase-like cupin family protein
MAGPTRGCNAISRVRAVPESKGQNTETKEPRSELRAQKEDRATPKPKPAAKSKRKSKSKSKKKPSRGRRALQKASPTRAEAKHLPWGVVELEELNPLLQRQFIVGNRVMVARLVLRKGCIIPLHSHHNEQVTCILEGALKFWIDGKEVVVHAGEVLTIPPHMPHRAEAVVDTINLDIFDPPRKDWIDKTDVYLRAKR